MAEDEKAAYREVLRKAKANFEKDAFEAKAYAELERKVRDGAFGVANLDNEEWARSSSVSAPRVGSFDILFVGGHEAVRAVAVEPPPPIPRSRSRLPHLSDACAHPSAARTRASCVASGRDDRAPHVQGRWVGWVDDAGRASGRLLRCMRRRGPLESHHHRAWPRWPAHGWSPRIHCLCRG